MSYFPPYSHSRNKIEVKLDLSNYATKNATGVDTSQFAKKDDLANLKTEVDKLDIDKLAKLDTDELKPVPTDFSKLSEVVKNNAVKKTEYDAKIKDIQDKILSITNLATNASLNAKINETKNEIPTITNLATTDALSAVENKIPKVFSLKKSRL